MLKLIVTCVQYSHDAWFLDGRTSTLVFVCKYACAYVYMYGCIMHACMFVKTLENMHNRSHKL